MDLYFWNSDVKISRFANHERIDEKNASQIMKAGQRGCVIFFEIRRKLFVYFCVILQFSLVNLLGVGKVQKYE